jgi:hypothetical protein
MKIEIKNSTLILGRAEEEIEILPSDFVVVSDPPYGHGDWKFGADGGVSEDAKRPGWKPNRRTKKIEGNNKPFDPSPMTDKFPRVGLFGANHFAARLPETGSLHAWDKLEGRDPWDSFSDVEFFWTSKKQASRIKPHLWKGIIQGGGYDKGSKKFHCSQKPVEVMLWCLDLLGVALEDTVVDPYLGSGSTGVACALRGIPFIGIECDEENFKIAEKRIRDAHDRAAQELFKP